MSKHIEATKKASLDSLYVSSTETATVPETNDPGTGLWNLKRGTSIANEVCPSSIGYSHSS